MLEPAASRLPPERVDRFECEAYLPRCTVGGGKAEHESRRVDGREDDMVMRVGNSLVLRETNR